MNSELINEEILRIQGIMSLPKNKILNEGVPDLIIKNILGKQVLKSLLTITERDLVEKFLKSVSSTMTDIEKKELGSLLKTNKGSTLIKELETEAKASTNPLHQGALYQKITELKSLETISSQSAAQYVKDVAKGFKDGWKTPGVLLDAVENILFNRTWPLKNLSAEEKKRFYMWFFSGTKVLPKELLESLTKLGLGPMAARLGGEFVKRYLFLVGFFSFCKTAYILTKNNETPEYEYDPKTWDGFWASLWEGLSAPNVKWTSPAYFILPSIAKGFKAYCAGGSLLAVREALKNHMKETSISIKKMVQESWGKVEEKSETAADKISDSKPGFIFWTKLPNVKKKYDDYLEGIGYTKNPDETWVWDETKNTFVPY